MRGTWNFRHQQSMQLCVCVCGAKTMIHKAEQDRRLIQFLMGLNEVYTVVRGSILMMNPLPTIAQGFSILIQEEKQREVKPRSYLTMEGTSLNAHGGSQFKTNYNTQYNNNTGNMYSQQSGNFQQKGSSSGLRLFCDYCKKPGHIKDKCYRLHGFPPNFKFTKGKNAATAAAVHRESGESFTGHHEDTSSQRGGSNTFQH